MAGIETLVEDGTVRSVEKGELVVLVERQDACASCAARGVCTTLGPRERVVRVRRRRGDPEVGPGDRVTLEIRSLTFIRASLLGYLVPTVAFFAGVAAVLLLTDEGDLVLGLGRDLTSFAAGLVGVAAAFGGLWLAGSRPAARERYSPRIIAVRPGGDRPPPGP
ncbi:MAG: SoxR reducing system RseC family protein [Deltaproteobacteria bacterium]|nr:SoxR reducing system RseC family protein [Deltaproteobacteria bacterium]